jgi:hypothetical protein
MYVFAGQQLYRWGHMALRRHLANEMLPARFTGAGASVICQYSSQGSLSEKWMAEFYDSLCAGKVDGVLLFLAGRLSYQLPIAAHVAHGWLKEPSKSKFAAAQWKC